MIDDCRMSLTEAMNAGAHGHIHELLGGTWAEEWTDLSLTNRTEEIVFPFLHSVVVSYSVLHYTIPGTILYYTILLLQCSWNVLGMFLSSEARH